MKKSYSITFVHGPLYGPATKLVVDEKEKKILMKPQIPNLQKQKASARLKLGLEKIRMACRQKR